MVLIHQLDDVAATEERIKISHPASVIGRFKMSRLFMTGIDGVDEIVFALSQYDTEMFWPLDSRVTYTQYFARAAFASGWRFAQHAKEIHDLVVDLRAKNGLPSTGWSWPMKTFESMVSTLLTRVAGKDPAFTGFTREQLSEALLRCKYLELELARVNQK